MNQEKIGKFIKEQRTKLGISQNELGEKVHVTRQAVSNWENGKTLPDKDILMVLSKLFDVSINDILAGGEKENLEQITIQLLDENNKKDETIKRNIIISIIITLSLIILFLGYYFINNYNSINVFRASANSKSFVIRDGIIISTGKNTYFKLGKLEVKNKNNDIDINHIKLYIQENKKENVIFESDLNDRLFINKTGYDELHKKKFKKNKNNIYLEVTYNTTEKETMKIELREDFKNDYTILLEESYIVKNKLSIEEEQVQYAFYQEEKDFEINNQVRKEEFKSVVKQLEYTPQTEVSENKEDTPIVEPEPTPIENPTPTESETITLTSNKKPSIEEIVDEQQEEPPKENTIDYNEIINIIETHGVLNKNTYMLDYYLEDGSYVVISKFYEKINVEYYSADFTIMENYSYHNESIEYELMENFITMDKRLFIIGDNNEKENEIIDKMNNFLSLVYKKIE